MFICRAIIGYIVIILSLFCSTCDWIGSPCTCMRRIFILYKQPNTAPAKATEKTINKGDIHAYAKATILSYPILVIRCKINYFWGK